MRIMKLFSDSVIVLTVIYFWTLILPHTAYAQVIINEVFPAPSSGDEWVEVKNIATSSVNLTGWIIEDNTGVVSTIPSFSNASFNGDGLAVLEIKNRLNNAGDHVTLRRPDGTIADYFEYTASTTDQSWSRVNTTGAEFLMTAPSRGSSNFIPSPAPSPLTSATPSATPSLFPTPFTPPSPLPSPLPSAWISPLPTNSSPNPSPSVSPLASYPLQLSEIMSCPQTSEAEWIEFFNPNSVTVTITNWKVKDASSNSRSLNISINPHSFASQDLSSAILNNDGDTFTIVDQDANPLISIEVPACEKGQSTVYSGGSWQQTLFPTKNAFNVFQPISDLNTENVNSPSPLTIDNRPFQTESYPSTRSGTFTNEVFPASYRFADQQLSSEGSSESASPQASSAAESITDAASQSASDGSVLGDADLATSSASSVQSFYTQKPFLIGLFIISILALSIGGYGIYQWYTELHVESVLEDL